MYYHLHLTDKEAKAEKLMMSQSNSANKRWSRNLKLRQSSSQIHDLINEGPEPQDHKPAHDKAAHLG